MPSSQLSCVVKYLYLADALLFPVMGFGQNCTCPNDTIPPVIDCPADISVDSPSDIPDPATVSVTDNCDGTSVLEPLDPSEFHEAYYGLLDEPGFCPDSVYRYYIAQDDCGNTDTCVQVVRIAPQQECALCQDAVNHHPVNFTDSTAFANVAIICAELNGSCCDSSWPDRCVTFDVKVPPGAVGLQITTGLGTGVCDPNNFAGEWQVDCGVDVEFAGNILCLEGVDTMFTLIHCKPGAFAEDYFFNLYSIVDLGPDTIVTHTDTILDSGAGWSAYLWSTGETTRTIEVTTSGTYSVTVTDSVTGCDAHDEIFVDFTTGVIDISDSENISIYPNPNSGSFRISFDLPHDKLTSVSVMNVYGQTIYQTQPGIDLGDIQEVDLASAPPGIYFIRIEGGGVRYIGNVLIF